MIDERELRAFSRQSKGRLTVIYMVTASTAAFFLSLLSARFAWWMANAQWNPDPISLYMWAVACVAMAGISVVIGRSNV